MPSYLRKRGDPRPIGFTAQEISMVFLTISVIFMAVTVKFPNRYVMDQGRYWYVYDIETLGFMFFLIFIFSAIAVISLCYVVSRYDLNMWTDRVNKDWQSTLRIDKNGLASNQIMKKDSLGFIKGIAFGKKAGMINRGGFRLTLPNGNTLLLVLDFMSHNADPLEAVGWSLFKKKHGIIGYNAYLKAKKEKKTLLTFTKESKKVVEEELKKSRIGETIIPTKDDATGLISLPEDYHKKKKRRWFRRRKK